MRKIAQFLNIWIVASILLSAIPALATKPVAAAPQAAVIKQEVPTVEIAADLDEGDEIDFGAAVYIDASNGTVNAANIGPDGCPGDIRVGFRTKDGVKSIIVRIEGASECSRGRVIHGEIRVLGVTYPFSHAHRGHEEEGVVRISDSHVQNMVAEQTMVTFHVMVDGVEIAPPFDEMYIARAPVDLTPVVNADGCTFSCLFWVDPIFAVEEKLDDGSWNRFYEEFRPEDSGEVGPFSLNPNKRIITYRVWAFANGDHRVRGFATISFENPCYVPPPPSQCLNNTYAVATDVVNGVANGENAQWWYVDLAGSQILTGTGNLAEYTVPLVFDQQYWVRFVNPNGDVSNDTNCGFVVPAPPELPTCTAGLAMLNRDTNLPVENGADVLFGSNLRFSWLESFDPKGNEVLNRILSLNGQVIEHPLNVAESYFDFPVGQVGPMSWNLELVTAAGNTSCPANVVVKPLPAKCINATADKYELRLGESTLITVNAEEAVEYWYFINGSDEPAFKGGNQFTFTPTAVGRYNIEVKVLGKDGELHSVQECVVPIVVLPELRTASCDAVTPANQSLMVNEVATIAIEDTDALAFRIYQVGNPNPVAETSTYSFSSDVAATLSFTATVLAENGLWYGGPLCRAQATFEALTNPTSNLNFDCFKVTYTVNNPGSDASTLVGTVVFTGATEFTVALAYVSGNEQIAIYEGTMPAQLAGQYSATAQVGNYPPATFADVLACRNDIPQNPRCESAVYQASGPIDADGVPATVVPNLIDAEGVEFGLIGVYDSYTVLGTQSITVTLPITPTANGYQFDMRSYWDYLPTLAGVPQYACMYNAQQVYLPLVWQQSFTFSGNGDCAGWTTSYWVSDSQATVAFDPAANGTWQAGETQKVVTATATFPDGEVVVKTVTIERPFCPEPKIPSCVTSASNPQNGSFLPDSGAQIQWAGQFTNTQSVQWNGQEAQPDQNGWVLFTGQASPNSGQIVPRMLGLEENAQWQEAPNCAVAFQPMPSATRICDTFSDPKVSCFGPNQFAADWTTGFITITHDSGHDGRWSYNMDMNTGFQYGNLRRGFSASLIWPGVEVITSFDQVRRDGNTGWGQGSNSDRSESYHGQIGWGKTDGSLNVSIYNLGTVAFGQVNNLPITATVAGSQIVWSAETLGSVQPAVAVWTMPVNVSLPGSNDMPGIAIVDQCGIVIGARDRTQSREAPSMGRVVYVDFGICQAPQGYLGNTLRNNVQPTDPNAAENFRTQLQPGPAEISAASNYDPNVYQTIVIEE